MNAMSEAVPIPGTTARPRGWRRLMPLRRLRQPGALLSVLRLSGVIGRTGLARGAGMSLEGLERSIERAFAPRRLSAVALSINSPGGSPVQSALIARRIRQRAEERGVPVIAFVEDVAASGGYWLACAADEIFADENSIVGSIGVISAGFGFADFIERHGIERRIHAAGPRKGMLDPFRPEVSEDVASLLDLQSEMHESFKANVRARRGRRLKGEDEVLFSGAFWTGGQAVGLGLIDGLGDMQTILRERFGEDVRVRPITRRSSLRRRIGVGTNGVRPGDLALEVVAALDEWAMWKRFGL